MTGDGCRAELFGEQWREQLKAACAEDPDIWPIYSISFDTEHFDQSIDLFSNARRNRTFVLFEGEELAGMSSFLGIDEGRQCLEIGGTFYRPHLRGTGFNRRVKDMMLRRAFDCGGLSSGSTNETSAARRRWPSWVRRAKASCVPIASPGPVMSATRSFSRS
jgi:RimJ/RimL family protein N-acetyltransferase